MAPAILFIATLAIMLFRPPDLNFYDLDRIAFLALLFVTVLRIFLRREPFHFSGPVLLPMFALTLLALAGALSRPYEPQIWSVLAAKWLVPFTMFWLAGHIFQDQASQRKLEIFFWIVLAYLSVIAALFLFNASSFIFPRYILDENLGIHADRARGPFLQAVANGVALNLLALFALNSFRRRRLPAWMTAMFFVLVPIAILATKTRAVWLSFALSILVLLFTPDRRIRVACFVLVLAGAAASWVVLSSNDQQASSSISSRLEEASPVEFRKALYQAGWEMFLEKPFIGWPSAEIQPEIERRISEFHQEVFYFHNTFLEVAVGHGIVGFALYVWVFIDLLGLRRFPGPARPNPRNIQIFDSGFRHLWPVLVLVYVLNACFVGMNYQFVNAIFFTVAGILAAQNRCARRCKLQRI